MRARQRGRDDNGHGMRRTLAPAVIFSFIVLLSVMLFAQNQLPDGPKPQNNAPQALPEAPAPQANAPQESSGSSTSKATPRQPEPMPSGPTPGTETQPSPVAQPPAQSAPAEAETPSGTVPGPQPPATIRTVPPGSVPTSPQPGSRDDLGYKIRTNVNLVVVPVTVKNSSGHLVEGLLSKDFSVYEDGKKQNISFFTSDPFPLSAAVVLDLGMPDNAFSKVRNTLPALIGAFGQFDEVSVFTYGNTVKQWQGFTAATKVQPSVFRQLKSMRAANSGAPVVGGPLGQSTPTVNGIPVDRGQMTTMPNTMIRTSHVLNDAILAAALELGKREPTRRKIIFVVSDGREIGSSASYAEVMKVLLSNNVSVYGIGVGGAALPVYGKLQKFHIPGFGYGDILPKYASATGGQVYAELNQSAIESAYGNVTEDARNQYTIGYTTRATPSSTYRDIEVRVDRPNLRVYAKSGYYPLPPAR